MRYLFCAFAAIDSLRPAIGLAQAVVRRGHTAAFVTDSGKTALLGQAGLVRIAHGPSDGPSFHGERSSDPLEIVSQVQHLDYAIKQFDPDVLVGQELALGPVIASERHNLPLATLGRATYLWPLSSDVPAVYQAALRRHERFVQGYNAARALMNLPPRALDPFETALIGDLLLLRSIPELEGNLATLPTQVEFVGNCDWEMAPFDNGIGAWIAAARTTREPIVYMQSAETLDASFWEALVATASDLAIRIVAAVEQIEQVPAQLPPNFFVRPQIPAELVLPHAQAVISHGSDSSVLNALSHGLPLLFIPNDEACEAATLIMRCINAGVARVLGPAERSGLGSALSSLLTEKSVRQQTRQLQQLLGQAGGAAWAALLLEDFAARKRARYSFSLVTSAAWQPASLASGL